MREIKFRGKSILGNNWTYGFLTKKKIRSSDEILFAIATGDCSLAETTPIDSQTIGQFTGLKDVYGVDIYEGDIIQSVNHLTEIFEVAMIDGAFRILAEGFKGEDLYRTLKHDNFKVIGNIHDNPDLLEGVD